MRPTSQTNALMLGEHYPVQKCFGGFLGFHPPSLEGTPRKNLTVETRQRGFFRPKDWLNCIFLCPGIHDRYITYVVSYVKNYFSFRVFIMTFFQKREKFPNLKKYFLKKKWEKINHASPIFPTQTKPFRFIGKKVTTLPNGELRFHGWFRLAESQTIEFSRSMFLLEKKPYSV